MKDQKNFKLSQSQKEYLKIYFDSNSRPSACERSRLACKFNVHDDKIKNWFQNRRAKVKCMYGDQNSIMFQEYYKKTIKVYPTCNSLYIRRDD